MHELARHVLLTERTTVPYHRASVPEEGTSGRAIRGESERIHPRYFETQFIMIVLYLRN
jgi:hypothetical protein